jgi:HK97 family phage major capsid protein
MPNPNFDFGGYATKNDLKCTDGRIIMRDAFKHQDGVTVPLVWQHLHDEPANVLGHAVLENREDGVYAYAYLNNSENAKEAKELVKHKDVSFLSIYANQLIEKSKQVMHGVIREVSLVLSGANPGALIDYVAVQHADGEVVESEDEAVIYTGIELEVAELQHEDEEDDLEHAEGEEETVGDVFESLSDKQKTAVYAIIGQLLETGEIKASADDEDDETSNPKGDIQIMKKNVFDGRSTESGPILSHADFNAIMEKGRQAGSLRKGWEAHVATLPPETQELIHAGTYGIGSDRTNLELLFPDAQNVTKEPTFIARRMEWVSSVMNGVRHSPFSRIKSLHADITADEARAKGYVTGDQKLEEVFPVLRRVTTPTTIYKKQRLDRDDIVDITDFNVVAWLKREMRVMLDEEIARAVLVGDGRGAVADKIDETNIRPVWTDDSVYIHQEVAAFADTTQDLIDDIIGARVEYRGSGQPTCFMAPSLVTAMLLLRDADGYRMYKTLAELAAELRVSSIVEVPVMEGLVHTPVATEYALRAIIVNLSDYTVGADKGGEINMFDDFDIDYNQQKYLIETRISGALTVPKSAVVLEQLTS